MYNIAQFYISNENLLNFKRYVKKPYDCVINALEIIGILNGTNADLMRIAVGDTGLDIYQIENIFSYIEPSFHWRFVRYSNIKTLVEFCFQTLKPSMVIFCGYLKGDFRHVFLIGKTNQMEIKYIDPQLNLFCNLKSKKCYTNIHDAQEYYILQTTANQEQVTQLFQDL